MSVNQNWLRQLPLPPIKTVRHVSGGDINQAFEIKTADQTYFMKVQANQPASYFDHEKHGLKALSQAIKTPTPLLQGQINGDAYLILDWIATGIGSQADLGKAIANLHQIHAKQFGFDENHQTKALIKDNHWNDDWADFYVNQRLEPEIKTAIEHGVWNDWRNLHYQKMKQAFTNYYQNHHVVPSLLHGDLWYGNVMFDQAGTPVLIDPDAIYGDREFDLAMTTIFGGFEPAFYQAYQAEYPLATGWQERLAWYQFYYLCMHLILFGETYGPAVDNILSQY